MDNTLTVAEYISYLAGHENKPVDLNFLLMPFGFNWGPCEGSEVLIGFIVEELYTMEPIKKVDCFDIVGIAWMLGHDPAEAFFSEGPLLIASQQSLNKQGDRLIH